MIKDKEEEVAIFQGNRGKTYGESSRSEVQEKEKYDWKDENIGKRGNYTRGNNTSYSKNSNNGKRDEISWFKGTIYKYGKEENKAFECTNSCKKVGGSGKKCFVL